MAKIKHKFLNHDIDESTEVLIIGTFNPECEGNDADFFYSRNRNYLWKILPTAFEQPNLKGAEKELKLNFIKKYKIDFIDLIEEVEVTVENVGNYSDIYLDSHIVKWNEKIEQSINRLNKIKLVCFTRQTFHKIPNIKNKVDTIQKICNEKNIIFKEVVTPARFYNLKKQLEWDLALNEIITKYNNKSNNQIL